MGKITGFLEFERADRAYEPVEQRIKHWREFVLPLPDESNKQQAARCMDCGIPYCHTGCPVNNQIPDWNDLVYKDRWEEAARNLHSTNNFPEVTCRLPGALRSVLHTQHRRQPGRHQDHRMRDRGPCYRERLGEAGAGIAQDRQKNCGDRFRPCWHGLRATTRARRA